MAMPMPIPSLHCACTAARRGARLLTRLYDNRLRTAGVEAAQFVLLMTLEQAGPCSQIQLGRRYDLEKTTVSRNLKLLQSKGWIELQTSAADRRIRQFALSPEGRARLSAAKPHWKAAQDQLLKTMGSENWDAMFRAFQTIVQAAKTLES